MIEETPFSKAAIKLLNDSQLIKDKNSVLNQIEKQLIQLRNTSKAEFSSLSINSPLPKVSKGENLEGFPFRILDYPRIFSKKDVFAFRTLLWWGNFISFTLHLKGKYLRKHIDQLKQLLSDYNIPLYISSSGNEWNHKPADKNYILLKSATLGQLNIEKINFLKIVQIEPIDKINQLNALYELYLHRLIVPLSNDR